MSPCCPLNVPFVPLGGGKPDEVVPNPYKSATKQSLANALPGFFERFWVVPFGQSAGLAVASPKGQGDNAVLSPRNVV